MGGTRFQVAHRVEADGLVVADVVADPGPSPRCRCPPTAGRWRGSSS
ncbi:MAG: hypothetical protein IPO75_09530 [Betaproteobacteria bacterium]|nr:hypothetical protein [Betaproteobacteria bacterium]